MCQVANSTSLMHAVCDDALILLLQNYDKQTCDFTELLIVTSGFWEQFNKQFQKVYQAQLNL